MSYSPTPGTHPSAASTTGFLPEEEQNMIQNFHKALVRSEVKDRSLPREEKGLQEG
jgi:hypothetical protein